MRYRPFAHLGLKAISVGLAVFLWLLVGQQALVERVLRVPRALPNLPENLDMVEPPQESVDIPNSGIVGCPRPARSRRRRGDRRPQRRPDGPPALSDLAEQIRTRFSSGDASDA